MLVIFLCLIAVVALGKKRKKTKTVELLYKQGSVENDEVYFSCGCRFKWVPIGAVQQEPRICQAHRALIDAEVAR